MSFVFSLKRNRKPLISKAHRRIKRDVLSLTRNQITAHDSYNNNITTLHLSLSSRIATNFSNPCAPNPRAPLNKRLSPHREAKLYGAKLSFRCAHLHRSVSVRARAKILSCYTGYKYRTFVVERSSMVYKVLEISNVHSERKILAIFKLRRIWLLNYI